ncbi:MAG TPA: peptide ABC transporter substrate-binding protein [Candidatus Dormibacteraeota bacterium]|nr:peptide ABC transporter substrate-binding protein [Candidatus Dormibacteraeota bacterium]
MGAPGRLLLGLALVLAACGGGAPAGSAPAGPDDPHNQGGTVTIGVVQEPTSFLAAGIVDSMLFSVAVDAPVAEGLLWYRPLEQTARARTLADFWRPMLAVEVPTTENGDVRTAGCPVPDAAMCVTWKLRGDVVWHDGSRFGAHDVCATAQFYWLRYHAHNPTAVQSTAGPDQLTDCREDSPTQATLSFRTRYGGYLSLGSGVYGILPASMLENAFRTDTDLERTPQTVDLRTATGAPDAYHGTDTLDRIIVGTGPYVLERYEPTKSITLVRNRHYWDRSRQPHLDRVIFKFISDVTSQLAQANAGEIDVGLDYRLALLGDLDDAAKLGRLTVQTIPESGAEKLDFDVCAAAHGLCGAQARLDPVTADPRFRQAVIRAIDRQQIVRTIARGQTTVPQDSWISLGEEYIRDPSIPTTAHDPAEARRILDAAGYRLGDGCHGGRGRADPQGHCIDLDFVTTSGNPARQQAQIAIQADLEQVGIFTNLSTVKAGRLFGAFGDGGILSTHQFDLAMYGQTGSPEPDGWYSLYHADCGGACPDEDQIPSPANRGQGQNAMGLDDPAVDRAFDEGRATVDLAQRTAAYRQAQRALAADLPEVPLYQQVVVNSLSAGLRGVQRNDRVWTFNMYDWYCTGGRCQP